MHLRRTLLALGGSSVAHYLVSALYLVTGKIKPSFEPGSELNIGGSTVSSAVCLLCGWCSCEWCCVELCGSLWKKFNLLISSSCIELKL